MNISTLTNTISSLRQLSFRQNVCHSSLQRLSINNGIQFKSSSSNNQFRLFSSSRIKQNNNLASLLQLKCYNHQFSIQNNQINHEIKFHQQFHSQSLNSNSNSNSSSKSLRFNQLTLKNIRSLQTASTIVNPKPADLPTPQHADHHLDEALNSSKINSNSTSNNNDLINSSPIKLTDSAIQRIKQLRLKHGTNNLWLRLTVDTGGCSGFEYKFELEKCGKSDDIELNEQIYSDSLIMDSVSLLHLKGSTIDYKSSIERSAFEVVSNPNAVSACGCGSSFQSKIT